MVAISIIMPVYNGERYLAEAISSILNQTFKDFELIIVNDGSTDGSTSIVRKYMLQDKRIVFVDRKQNKKLPYTLNEGISLSKGKYISRMDSDDIAFSEKLSEQYDYLEKNPFIYLIGTSYLAFNTSSEQKLVKHPIKSVELAYKCISNTFFCHPTVMFRAELIKSVGYYEDVEAEDFRYFSKITALYPCANLIKPLLFYREHSLNRSTTFKKELLQSLEETTALNINKFIYSDNIRRKYTDYRLGKNKSIKQYMYCYWIDVFVVYKICRTYKKIIFYFQGIKVLAKILSSNLVRAFKKK